MPTSGLDYFCGCGYCESRFLEICQNRHGQNIPRGQLPRNCKLTPRDPFADGVGFASDNRT